MNLLQMAQRLHRESGRSGNGPTTLTGATKEHQRLADWLNDAWAELQERPIDWAWMRKRLTAGTLTTGRWRYVGADLGLSDFGRWRPASPGYAPLAFLPSEPANKRRLHWMPLDRFRAGYIDADTQAGPPLDWSIDDDGALLIGPQSDQSYSLVAEYLRATTTLTNDADEPNLPAQHHMLLVWRALVEVAKFDNAADVLARASSNFGRAENTLLAQYARPLHFGGPLA